MAMVLACTSCVRFRQREESEQREAVSPGSLYLLIFKLLRIFPILFTIVMLLKMMEGDKCYTSPVEGSEAEVRTGAKKVERHRYTPD